MYDGRKMKSSDTEPLWFPNKHAVGTVTVGEDHEMDLMENDRWYGGRVGTIEVEREGI